MLERGSPHQFEFAGEKELHDVDHLFEYPNRMVLNPIL